VRCKAKAKSTGERCKRSAVAGCTVCRVHGANKHNPGGAPAKNKNSVKHGVYEQVVIDCLTPEEQELYKRISAANDMTQELKILRFKMLRLLDDVEQERVIGTPMGAQVVKLKVDEVQKAFALEKLADGIRKIVKDINITTDSDSPAIDELVKVLRERREAMIHNE
jgi:hypothetical protein